jgi:hypothetical protein
LFSYFLIKLKKGLRPYMTNKFLLTSIIVGFTNLVHADIRPAEGVEQAKAQAELKCVEGCLVLSPAEIAATEEGIKEALQKAYEAGLKGWNSRS